MYIYIYTGVTTEGSNSLAQYHGILKYNYHTYICLIQYNKQNLITNYNFFEYFLRQILTGLYQTIMMIST